MAREVEERRLRPDEGGLSDASRNPVSREAASARISSWSPSCRHRTWTLARAARLRGLGARLGLGARVADWLGLGLAVLVTSRVRAPGSPRTARRSAQSPAQPRTRGRSPASPSRARRCTGRRTGDRSRSPAPRPAGRCVRRPRRSWIVCGQSWLDQIRSSPEAIFTTRDSGETSKVHAGWVPAELQPDHDRPAGPGPRHCRQHADLVVAALAARRREGRLGLEADLLRRGHRTQRDRRPRSPVARRSWCWP